MRAAAHLAVLLTIVGRGSVYAQQAKPSVLAVDAVAAVDTTVDAAGARTTGVMFDSLVSADLGRGFQGLVRPMAQRLARTGEWNRQIQVAALRYERVGPVAIRIDGGYIVPPVGLANLTLRPHLNPTIAQPSSLFQALPSLQAGYPRATLLGGLYPLGATATASALHWDLRVGVIDASPLRVRRVFAPVNPPRFANTVVGGGISPAIGMRMGASVTRGGWLRGGESPAVKTSRSATVLTVEADWSFRYTQLAGEWTRDGIETDTGDRVASGWFVQGQQTLSPRLFAAGRFEWMSSTQFVAVPQAGASPTATLRDQTFKGVEETVGFRLTPDLTLRVGHRARMNFGETGFTHQAEASIVWAKRVI